MVDCRNCGAPVPEERVQLGYDYCTRRECVATCLKRPAIVAVNVNKASDQYVRRGDLDIPVISRSAAVSGDPGYPSPSPRKPEPRYPLEMLSDAGRIAKLERDLDKQLAELGPDDHGERIRLINEFNASLRAFNIRYRTLARRTA